MNRGLDVVVIGAGAAGMSCAARVAQSGLRVALVDHWPKLGEKIRISGGGRCNFTNLQAGDISRYAGGQPAFARHALRALPPARVIGLMRQRGIAYHEKHRGQLFLDGSAQQLIDALRSECDEAGVRWLRPVTVTDVASAEGEADHVDRKADHAHGFLVRTREAGTLECSTLVVATGGLAMPQLGASDLGLRIARRFGLRVAEPRPALVPLEFDASMRATWSALAGLSVPVRIRIVDSGDAPAFDEDLLFTHRGLSGPAILQISTYWRKTDMLSIDLAGDRDLAASLLAAKRSSRQQLASVLAEHLPKRLAAYWLDDADRSGQTERGRDRGSMRTRRIAELSDRDLVALATRLQDWRFAPAGTAGYRKAEVMAGGVAVDELEPRTMQARRARGLYFIGEVVDVTGWLGGYNFQWAWSSARLAADAIVAGIRLNARRRASGGSSFRDRARRRADKPRARGRAASRD